MTYRPLIHVYALGGTIAMTPGSAGVQPTLTANDLVSAVPALAGVADIHTETLFQMASANLTPRVIEDLCQRAAGCGADGVLFTQGTDSIEESAYLASLLYRGDIPLVFTAAMRSANLPGADGPANLFDSICVLKQQAGQGRRVSVVMNGQIHDPVRVRKAHTSSVSAFVSEGGPVGTVVEGQVFENIRPAPFVLPDFAALPKGPLPRIAIVTASLGDDALLLDAAARLYDGLVIQAFGGGHVSELWADRLADIAGQLPVVLSTRVEEGRIYESSYGYKGAEIDLIKKGLVPAKGLSALKARLALCLVLAADSSEWQQNFNQIAAAA